MKSFRSASVKRRRGRFLPSPTLMYPIAPSLTSARRWSSVMFSFAAACSGVSRRLLSLACVVVTLRAACSTGDEFLYVFGG